jgi:hypothetical protein
MTIRRASVFAERQPAFDPDTTVRSGFVDEASVRIKTTSKKAGGSGRVD